MVSAVQFCFAYIVVDVLCITLTVIIASNISRDSGSETQVRYIFLLLTAYLVFLIGDALWAILAISQQFQPSRLVLGIVNGMNLLSVAFAGYFWAGFSLSFFNSQATNNKVLRYISAIPAIMVVPFHIIGYITNQNVILMPDGSVEYGIMHTMNVLVPLLYLTVATGVSIHYYRKAQTRNQRRTSLVFILFMLAPAASGICDIFIPNTPVVAASVMISLVLVMMALQESRISSDALTGLNNRRRAENFLEDSLMHASHDHPLYFFIIDMNDFKVINDTYGHLEGDHALQLMANALRNVSSETNTFAARWGGDEFVIISTRSTTLNPDDISNRVREALDMAIREAHVDYSLSCSIGYTECDHASNDYKRMIADADAMLYQKKMHR